jgi:hypothetical protein
MEGRGFGGDGLRYSRRHLKYQKSDRSTLLGYVGAPVCANAALVLQHRRCPECRLGKAKREKKKFSMLKGGGKYFRAQK